MSSVRPAEVTDAVLLAAIHAEAMPPGQGWDADAIATQLGLPGGFGLLDAAGGMLLARVAADEAEILTLAVAPLARRRGHGAALLASAESRAAALGAATMYLEVSARNLAARALYGRAGYRQTGRRRGYYPDGADALVMAKPLVSRGAAAGA